jgi:glucose/mannose-6-phosphate isomerase
LRDQNELPRIKKRIEITKALLKPIFGEIDELWAEGKSVLARIMSLIIFGDYLSVYCAVLKGIDPTPVEIITKLKEKLLY